MASFEVSSNLPLTTSAGIRPRRAAGLPGPSTFCPDQSEQPQPPPHSAAPSMSASPAAASYFYFELLPVRTGASQSPLNKLQSVAWADLVAWHRLVINDMVRGGGRHPGRGCAAPSGVLPAQPQRSLCPYQAPAFSFVVCLISPETKRGF